MRPNEVTPSLSSRGFRAAKRGDAPAVMEVLEEALEEGDGNALELILPRAAGLEAPGLPDLLIATAARWEHDARVARTYAYAFSLLRDPRAIPILVRWLRSHDDAALKNGAALALVQIGTPDAIGALGDALHAEDAAQRLAALRSLKRFSRLPAAERARLRRDGSIRVRFSAVMARRDQLESSGSQSSCAESDAG